MVNRLLNYGENCDASQLMLYISVMLSLYSFFYFRCTDIYVAIVLFCLQFVKLILLAYFSSVRISSTALYLSLSLCVGLLLLSLYKSVVGNHSFACLFSRYFAFVFFVCFCST